MLSKNIVWRMNIDEYKNVSVARVTVFADDEEVGASPVERILRKAYAPGEDISELPAAIRKVINALWS